jgi:hypothetical protein
VVPPAAGVRPCRGCPCRARPDKMKVVILFFSIDNTYMTTKLNHKNIMKIEDTKVTVKFPNGKSYVGEIIGRASKLKKFYFKIFVQVLYGVPTIGTVP